jgi:Uma2 family endonuclease
MAHYSEALMAAWEPPPPSSELIFDDGVPLESNRHRIAMNALIRSLPQAFPDRTDFFAGGNMFVYFSLNQVMNQDYRGPDFFVVLEVDGSRERQGWVVWEENGRYPDVIVELLSPSTAAVDRGVKKDLYERTFRTSDYFIFDPFQPDSLQGWHLSNSEYQPLEPNDRGWLWCQKLNLWLGTWEGVIDREPPTGTCHWLRFYDREGNLIPLPEEAAAQRADQAEAQLRQAEAERQQAIAQAEQAEARAQALAERLRSLGIDPNSV